jgi:periplasmic divalent cation tolerance protein
MDSLTDSRYGVVLVTAPSRDEAGAIAQTLIQARRAACVSLFPIHSLYTWQGKLHQEDEWQLLIKCDLTKFQALETKVRQVHSYEVPEIIALPVIAGSQPYLNWLAAQVENDTEVEPG